jgi:hypothetical protein
MIAIKSYNYKNVNYNISKTDNHTNSSETISNTNISKNNENNIQYSLNHSFFDPSNSSPPNDFMQKLHLRMSVYNSLTKDDNFSTE